MGHVLLQSLLRMEMWRWQRPRMQQSQQAIVWPMTATSARARSSTPGHSSEAAKQGDREHEPKQSSLGSSEDGALRG